MREALLLLKSNGLKVLLGNTLLYPTSVSDCPGTERTVFGINLKISLAISALNFD